jgi:hypothetical protein
MVLVMPVLIVSEVAVSAVSTIGIKFESLVAYPLIGENTGDLCPQYFHIITPCFR